MGLRGVSPVFVNCAGHVRLKLEYRSSLCLPAATTFDKETGQQGAGWVQLPGRTTFSFSVDLPAFERLFLHVVGKVHGSLARAGKVRGQCPKVPKQDKKKTPKGRALKRIKYNRRFVNVGTWQCPSL